VRQGFRNSHKREFIRRRQFQIRAEARTTLFEWIEAFYNRERLYGYFAIQSPVDFEQQLN
jgi:putative transposase